MRRKMRRIGVAIALSGGLATAIAGAAFDPAREIVEGEVGRRIDGYLSSAALYGFSGQALVALDGAVVLHRAYGWADPLAREPLSVATPLGIASMSKRFAAAAILRLVADGRLSLDARLGDLLDGVPADKRGLELRQILVHSSGLRGGFEEDFEETSREASLRRLLGEPLVGEPGKQWRYSSEGYNLVAAIVDRARGESYEAFASRELFARMGLGATGFLSAPPLRTPPIAPARSGLRRSGSPASWPRNWRSRGGGDIVSTAADLYRAHLALTSGSVLPEALARSMVEPQFAIDEGVGYGFGTILSADEHGKLIEWAGDTELGYNGVLFDYPERHLVIVLLAPARDAFGRSLRQLVQAEVLRLALGEEVPPYPEGRAPTSEELARWPGSYPLRDGELDLFSDGAQLWLAPRGREATRALLGALKLDLPSPEAGERTERLLAQLRDGDLAALSEALGAEGQAAVSDYLEEWRGLVAKEGPLHGFAVVGETVRRGAVNVLVRLEFRDRARPMSWSWADGGRGRLAGSNPGAFDFPLLLAVAVSPRGPLVACDAWRVRCLTLTGKSDGSLAAGAESGATFATAAPSRAGWLPTTPPEAPALRR